MSSSEPKNGHQPQIHLLQALAEFRYPLRGFLQFSERTANQVKLHPRQHQQLLQVAEAPKGSLIAIAYAAVRLGLRHNSAVYLTREYGVDPLEVVNVMEVMAEPRDPPANADANRAWVCPTYTPSRTRPVEAWPRP